MTYTHPAHDYSLWMLMAAIVSALGVALYRTIGDRRGLRNPWVRWPLLAAIASLVIGLSLPVNNPIFTASAAAAGLVLFALFAARARTTRIAELLGIPKEVAINTETGDGAHMLSREIAESFATREDLEELLSLVEQTGGASHYRWLMPEWVRARLNEQRNGASLIRGSASQLGDGAGLNR